MENAWDFINNDFICQRCESEIATILYSSESENDRVTEFLCDECVRLESLLTPAQCNICDNRDKSVEKIRCLATMHFTDKKDGEYVIMICKNNTLCNTIANDRLLDFTKKMNKIMGMGKEAIKYRTCEICRNVIKKRQTCSVCRKGSFCSSECFQKAWPFHKKAFHKK